MKVVKSDGPAQAKETEQRFSVIRTRDITFGLGSSSVTIRKQWTVSDEAQTLAGLFASARSKDEGMVAVVTVFYDRESTQSS